MALRCLTISHWGKRRWVCCASESWRGRRRRRGVWSSTAVGCVCGVNTLAPGWLLVVRWFYFLEEEAGASEHFTAVSVSSQWQAFQPVWALVQMAVALAGWLVRS